MTISERTPDQDPDSQGLAARLSTEPNRPPAEVPGYDAERFLGRGAFGEVWVAVDRNTGYRVAIKFFAHRPGLDWSLLAREVDKLRQLRGDRFVVQLVTVGWEASPPFYVMDYLEKGSLDDRLKSGPLPVADAVELFRDVTTGLVHAHNRGILHCDLKPANILLDEDGHPRLADFGQARLADEEVPALGTLFYMAPEQTRPDSMPDARWDVYALGAVAYCMLTGQPPHRDHPDASTLKEDVPLAERLSRYRELITKAPPPTAHRKVPGVDHALAAIIDRCLAADRAERFANPQAVQHALEARALWRARRPVLLFGGLAPALLLLIMIASAALVVTKATADMTQEIRNRSQRSNAILAQLAADKIASRALQRWAVLEREASGPELLALFPEGPELPSPEGLRAVQAYLDRRQEADSYMHLASSWFVSDAQGRVLAASPRPDVPLDHERRFWHRDYFHGMGFDIHREDAEVLAAPRPANIPMIAEPHQSQVFRNRIDGKLICVASVPIGRPEQPRGTLCMTVHLGDFREIDIFNTEEFQAAFGGKAGSPSKLISLVQVAQAPSDPRAEHDLPGEGLFLEHAVLVDPQTVRRLGEPPLVYLPKDLSARIRERAQEKKQQLAALGPSQHAHQSTELISDPTTGLYRDPAADLGGEASQRYGGWWLAMAEPVVYRYHLSGQPNETRIFDPGWALIVQEGYDSAIRPVRDLERELLHRVLVGMGLIVLVMLMVWGLLFRGLSFSSRSLLARVWRRSAGLSSSSGIMTGRSAVSTDGQSARSPQARP